MAWESIRNKIVNILEGIDSIQEVQEFPSEEFNGFPVAQLETVRNESEFDTTNDNKRTYIFTIWILQDIAQSGMKKARRIIQGVVDDVMNAFDSKQLLETLEMPANEVLIISMPALSNIFTNIDAKYVVGEVELRIVTSFSIS